MSDRLRAGLVLTGGGARAAYQVGVLQALGSLPIDLVGVSAVGAGALNGVVMAHCPDAATAATSLKKLWSETILAEESALRIGPLPILRLGAYLSLLFAGGVQPELEERLKQLASGGNRMLKGVHRTQRSPSGDILTDAITIATDLLNVSTDAELDSYLSGAFKTAAGQPCRPFFVSVYTTGTGLLDATKHGLQLLGILESSRPRYLEVSSPALSEEDRIQAVLASASLPFLCEPGQFGGERFVDGSFSGMKRSPGAVPLQPFRRRPELNLDVVIVVHTEAGVSWDANEFDDVSIIEIRPSVDSATNDIGYFWPNKARLSEWINLGQKDADAVLGQFLRTREGWQKRFQTQDAFGDAASDL